MLIAPIEPPFSVETTTDRDPRLSRSTLPTLATTQTLLLLCTAERTCEAVVACVAPATHPEGGGGEGDWTVQLQLAGLGSVFAAASVARTKKV
jgi:hypothetical protein